GITSSPDEFGESTPSPIEQQDETRDVRRDRPLELKSDSDKVSGIEWTSNDERKLDRLSAYKQRKRKEQILVEKKREMAEMKRQLELDRKKRLKNVENDNDEKYSDDQDKAYSDSRDETNDVNLE
ncbi:unnamed protein product, partial [Didymodactylos carnosus]